MAFPCPLCGASSRARTSRMLSATTKETYYNCTNDDCCHQYKTLEGDPRTLAKPVSPAQVIPAEKLRSLPVQEKVPPSSFIHGNGTLRHILR